MPDDLKAIVQRMVDAGESEDNIATVIQHFARPTVPDAQADRPITVKDRQAQAWNFALPQPSAQHEPDTFWGGVGQSLKDQVLGATVGNPMLQGAAHPTSVGDLVSLALPNAGLPNASLRGALTSAGRAISAGGRAAIDGSRIASGQLPDPSLIRSTLRGVLRVLPAANREFNKTPTQLFNELPLTAQMDQAPEVAAPFRRGGDAPPLRAPRTGADFKDMPLYQQMESDPYMRSDAAPFRRGGDAPPLRAPRTGADFKDMPLYQQMESDPYMRSDAAPFRRGGDAPPLSQSHDLTSMLTDRFERGGVNPPVMAVSHESVSSIPTIRQGVYVMRPDGSYGVKAMGGPLQTGETVHVMNRAGNGQLHTINAVTDDGVGLLTSPTAEPLSIGGKQITDPSLLALLRKRLSGQP